MTTENHRSKSGSGQPASAQAAPMAASVSPPVERELSEPTESQPPISLTLIVVICSVCFWAGFYLQRYSGGFKAMQYDETSSGETAKPPAVAQPVDLYALGKRLFPDNCGKCHQVDGQGLPGQYPPLAGSEWVNVAGAARMIRIVLDGLQGPIQVAGKPFDNQMVPWREAFSDQQIAAVLTYVRGEKGWGNNASPVKPEEVATIREQTKTRPAIGPWTPPELLKISDTQF
jgi:mono/diheme cytochrome c family protein